MKNTQKKKISEIIFLSLENEKYMLSKKTYQTYTSKIVIFTDFLNSRELNDMPIIEFSKLHAQEFIFSYIKKHNTTRHAYKNTLKKFFNKLMEEEKIKINPFNFVKLPPRRATEQKRAFTRTEINNIKEHCIKHNQTEIFLFFQIMYYCYLRPHQELRLLKVNEISFENNTILVLANNAKNRQRQFVTIPEQLAPELKKWIEKKKLTKDDYIFKNDNNKAHSKRYFYDKSKEIFTMLNLSNEISLYSWKHTGVVEYYKQTKDIVSLQRQLRHHDISQVQDYLHSLGIIENENVKNNFPTF